MTPRRYLKILFGLLIGTITFIAVFNWVVDPYILFHSAEIKGFNQYKTDLYKYSRLSIANNLWRQAPENLIVGSSRVHFGFDTSEPFPDGHRYFNVGLLGSTLYEMTRYMQHAEARQPTRRLLVGLDMFMFNRYSRINDTFSESRLAVNRDGSPNNDFWVALLRDRFQSLFTYDALQTSVRTIAKQPLARKYGIDGFEGEAISLARDVKKYGPRTAFHRVQSEYPQEWCPPPRNVFELGDPNDPESPLGMYRSLLRHAHEKHIELRLFISPTHAYLREAMDRAGLWPTFEEWKRELVRINDEEASRASQPAFPIWDFSGYNQYTTEELPPVQSHELVQWYWEASHFRPALGKKMLDRIFGKASEQDANFGTLITTNNIEQHLQDIREARALYRSSHPQDMKEIDALGISPAMCRR